VFHVILLAVAVSALLLLYVFGKNITEFYWKIGPEPVRDIIKYTIFGCIGVILLLWSINIAFYFYYSRERFSEFYKHQYLAQLVANTVFICFFFIVFVGFPKFITDWFVYELEREAISFASRWKIWTPYGITFLILLLVAYFQVFLFPPANRTAPVWNNAALSNKGD
jgi:protein-S-isoprenylcysteine O-methyltransferase Ste14